MKTSVKAAVGGVSAALSVVLMFFGGIIYIFTYAVPMVLGVLMSVLKKTLTDSCALCVYAAVSVLSFIFVPEKEIVLMYVLFFGWYPLVREKICRIRAKVISFTVKLLLFNVCVLVIELIAYYAFGIPFFEDGVFSVGMLVLFTVLMNITFILYEFMLSKFLILYERRLEKRVLKIFIR